MDIDAMYNELIEKIKRYHPARDLQIIEKAYRFAAEAHQGVPRESGDPYISHPLAVAIILAELELDLESIAAALLHDTIEDTDYVFEDIVEHFGEEIAQLVDGVTKLAKMQYTSKIEEQAENYRRMFLAMAKDIRVILIKIADRLHNVRTLKFRLPEKQQKVAQETLDIYAPLAHRLGMSKLRYELEDLSFKYLNSEAYYDLADKISRKQSERHAFIQEIVEAISARLAETHITATVEGRPKHFFSIYKKMVGKEKTLDQIYDLFAVRILVNEIRDCYEALGMLHGMYTPVPGRLKDFIGMPKANRYQSLHTTLIGQNGEPFEVQIRTWEMHRISEYGVAAHWKYKSNKSAVKNVDSSEEKLIWLRQILEWQRDLSDSKEYLDALKQDLDLFKGHVYCFTPKGEVISLTHGATPVDFAYAIHSAVGNRMIGAKVNSRIVTFDYALSTGDRVEIQVSKATKGPSRDWLNLVKTSQARSKINQWFKQENRGENVTRGRELLENEAKKKKVPLALLLEDGREAIVNERYNCLDFESLCAAVGHGGVKENQVVGRLYAEYEKTLPVADEETIIQGVLEDGAAPAQRDRKKKTGIIVKGVGDSNVRISKCCTPLPGDSILGFITRGRGVSIHRVDCANILQMSEIDQKRIIEADWQLPENNTDNMSYFTGLRISCHDRDGLIADITRALADERVKIKSINTRMEQAELIISVGIEIFSREQLDHLAAKILRQADVHEVERAAF